MTNVKINENVVCWNCQHFQRYDQSDTPTACIGECRFKSMGCMKTGEDDNTAAIYVENYFPVIQDASQKWCGNFARSLEKNLPDIPPHDTDACDQQVTLPDDINIFRGFPWNKHLKAGYTSTPGKGSVCCWTCDHFNPKEATPDPLGTSGECRREPPCAYERGDSPLAYWMVGNFPSVRNGICEWCSFWERARRTVYTPVSGYSCVQGHYLESEEGGSTVAAVSTATAKKTAKKTK